MENKKASLILKILLNLMFFTFLILLLFLSYQLYLNIPRSPENLDITIHEAEETEELETEKKVISENTETESEVKQFYLNMKFNHNQISYKIEEDCETEKKQRMIQAFDELSSKVSKITFYSVLLNPDIEVICSQENKLNIDEKHFIAGEGGAKEIIQTGQYYIITNGVVYLYENIKTIKCNYPNVELHELIHVFGFDHSDNENSLMFPYLESCDQKLDDSIINKLGELYSKENLPDLYFENISAIKKGRYLDFDLIIKNSGSIDSKNVTLTIFDNEKIIEHRDLGVFKFGSGISLHSTNLKLVHLNPKQIRFIIDKDDNVKELDENNNIANIKLK